MGTARRSNPEIASLEAVPRFHGSADMATSTPNVSDFDPLISRLAAPLEPGDPAAFRAAAESALVGCSGEGIAYRTLRDVWRTFFHPSPDPRIGQTRHLDRRPSKLIAAPPLGEDSARCGERARNAFRAG